MKIIIIIIIIIIYRSTSGYDVCMDGSPVDWISMLQPIVTVSLTEAEYVA